MSNTINNGIPLVPENTIDPAAGLNLSLNVADALIQLRVVSVGTNAPPGSPAVGARYIIGTTPTGLWAGHAGQMARWEEGDYWSFHNAVIAVNQDDSLLYIRPANSWVSV